MIFYNMSIEIDKEDVDEYLEYQLEKIKNNNSWNTYMENMSQKIGEQVGGLRWLHNKDSS